MMVARSAILLVRDPHRAHIAVPMPNNRVLTLVLVAIVVVFPLYMIVY
jgi:hypothetical protein